MKALLLKFCYKLIPAYFYYNFIHIAFILLAFNIYVYCASIIVHSQPSFSSVKFLPSLNIFVFHFLHLWPLL